MCLAALASQTGGSITRPASYCGVASCKPTFGRVSADGVVPLASSMDHVGAIAGSVRDVALVLQTIAGADPRDPGCTIRPFPDLQERLKGPLPPPRLGRLRGLFETMADAEVRHLMDRVTDTFRKAGATVEEVALPAGFSEVISRHRTVMAVEAAVYHECRLRRHPEDYPPNIRHLLEEGVACSAPEYGRSKKHQYRLSQEIQGCFEGYQALLTPATTRAAPDAKTTGDPAFNSPWSYTGLPTVSLPAAWNADGLPMAIQLIGRSWDEAELLAAGTWCEEVLAFERREPSPVRG
jgi:aspartyl-tRNA(Asn)/glutamyl-tRNA(Gln) amidotransferase subunit A